MTTCPRASRAGHPVRRRGLHRTLQKWGHRGSRLRAGDPREAGYESL